MPNLNKWLLPLGLFTLVLCVWSYFYFDQRAISFYLVTDPGQILMMRRVTAAGDSLYPLLASGLLYLYARLRLRQSPPVAVLERLQRLRERAAFLFVAVASSGLLCDLIKFVCGRPRPVKWLTEGLYSFEFFETSSRMTSLPSGHSNTAVVLALVAVIWWRRSWPLALLFALAVMLSRVVLLKHFPSDTFAGAYIALVTTYALSRYFERRAPRGVGP